MDVQRYLTGGLPFMVSPLYPRPSVGSVSHADKYRGMGSFSYGLYLDSYSGQLRTESKESQWN